MVHRECDKYGMDSLALILLSMGVWTFLVPRALFIILLSSMGTQWALAGEELTTELCEDLGGQMVDKIVCPENGRVRTGRKCQLAENPLVFFNGCSVRFDIFRDTFFSACVAHDLCYHHEPASSGWSRKDCDQRFLDDMKNICKGMASGKGRKLCYAAAGTYYGGVRIGGRRSFRCSNEKLNREDLETEILRL